MPKTGLIDWMVDIADARLIGLDTLIEGEGKGTLRPDSLAHLARALETAEGRRIVIVLHHPPVKTGIRFMDNIALDNIDELSRVLERKSCRGHILAGHVHGVYVRSLSGMVVMTAPSTCSAFALDTRRDAPIGFMQATTGFALLDTGGQGAWSVIPPTTARDRFRFEQNGLKI